MVNSVLTWVFVIITGAVLGGLVGLFAVGIYWYGLRSWVITAEISLDWANTGSIVILFVSTMLGICCSAYYKVKD